jgi:restriction endonuclease
VKLHFEPDLDYQRDAIEAVCDLFRGQETCRNEFTVSLFTPNEQLPLGVVQNDLGVGNGLALASADMLANSRAVQVRNGLAPSESLDALDFTVEMETGTGKTYVYLRTIFELNKRYGFTKFVIVVPSIAIKEGVRKTLEMTEEHFRSIYAGTPSEYFLYDSAKLGQVRNFATSANVQIMVVTVGAINKRDVNNLYKESEKTGDERPVDLIKSTHPIVVVDEPQSVDGGINGAGRAALAAMDPLCTLRYSATHVDQHHMVYRLDAVDAYERKLVKQIEVASAEVVDAHNKPFVQLVSVNSRRNAISAKVLVDVQRKTGVERTEVTVHDGENLEETTGRALYHDCWIGELRVGRGAEQMELRVPGGEQYLAPGAAWGDAEPLAVQREMIRRTIREHFEKQARLRPHRIKVLSLFFIDAVDRYRRYDDDGNVLPGPYAQIFEEEYRRIAGNPAYQARPGSAHAPPADVHDGYFSIDKKNRITDTDEGTQSGRDNAERAYNLIMRDKEKLLSFETPLAFIFSHSALKEGWDNPNVFQICSVRDIHTERERRQTIGRGLRLCVDQSGNRVRGFDVNTLTVIATERYEEFANGLQSEIETATGVRFSRIRILNADERRTVKPRSAVIRSKAFMALWDRVKYQSAYRVEFDSEKLVADCTRAVQQAPAVPPARLQWRKAGIAIGRTGVMAVEQDASAPVVLRESAVELPDILTELQNRTQLTRRTIQRVLSGSGRLEDFRRNPQQFIELAGAAINRCKARAFAGGIRYKLRGDEHYYAIERLDEEIVGYVRSMVADLRNKSPYEYVVLDSGVETRFAGDVEQNSAVELFVKFPDWFTIPTPLGPYNPDWALLIRNDNGELKYRVVETKGSTSEEDLREGEKEKIACARAHYAATRVKESPAEYVVATTLDEVLSNAASALRPAVAPRPSPSRPHT